MSIVDLDVRRRPPAEAPDDRRARARAEADAAAAAGNPLSGAELARRTGIPERTVRTWLASWSAEGGGSRQPTTGSRSAAPPAGSRQPAADEAAAGAVAGNGNVPGSRQPTSRPAVAGGRQRARVPAAAVQPAAVPRSLVAVTVAAVAIVAVVAMVTSYSHTYDLAVLAGQARVAVFLPAAVDGLVIAGSTSLLVDHHLRRPGSSLARTAVALGLISSMAANVVAVDPTLVDLRVVKWVMAAYAPLALAVSGHLLLRMLGQGQTEA